MHFLSFINHIHPFPKSIAYDTSRREEHATKSATQPALHYLPDEAAVNVPQDWKGEAMATTVTSPRSRWSKGWMTSDSRLCNSWTPLPITVNSWRSDSSRWWGQTLGVSDRPTTAKEPGKVHRLPNMPLMKNTILQTRPCLIHKDFSTASLCTLQSQSLKIHHDVHLDGLVLHN